MVYGWQLKRYRLLAIMPYLSCGASLGKSRAVNKKYKVINTAAIIHGRNGRKNKKGNFMIIIQNLYRDLPCKRVKFSMAEWIYQYLENSFDKRLMQLTGLEPWLWQNPCCHSFRKMRRSICFLLTPYISRDFYLQG